MKNRKSKKEPPRQEPKLRCIPRQAKLKPPKKIMNLDYRQNFHIASLLLKQHAPAMHTARHMAHGCTYSVPYKTTSRQDEKANPPPPPFWYHGLASHIALSNLMQQASHSTP